MFETRRDGRRLITHTAIATITPDSITHAFLRWFEHPDFDPETPVLWDCRGQFLDVSFFEIGALDQLTIDRTERRRGAKGRSAILVSDRITNVAVQELERNPRFVATFGVFMDEAAARRWLGVGPTDQEPLPMAEQSAPPRGERARR